MSETILPSQSSWMGHNALMMWLACGARGSSSNAIVTHITGIPAGSRYGGRMDHPYDPDDLDRCLQLLEAVPLLRVLLPSMASASPSWAALIARWDEIEASHLEEVGLRWTKAHSAPKTYAMMKQALDTVPRPDSSNALNIAIARAAASMAKEKAE